MIFLLGALGNKVGKCSTGPVLQWYRIKLVQVLRGDPASILHSPN